MKNRHLKIEGQRIYLRVLTIKDATEKYCSWINDQEVHKYLDSKKTTIRELQEYISIRMNDPNCLFLGIFLINSNIHIGNIKLEPIDFNEKKATLGIMIGEKLYWNRGFATEALKLLTNYAFRVLKMSEINLGVYKENVAAIKAYKKIGFEIYEENEKVYKLKMKN